MTSLERVLSALEARGCAPKKSGDGHYAKCPAHHDQRPSLSIGAGDDGRVLLRCHAGCTVRDIIAKLELTLKDLMPVNGHGAVSKRNIVATYSYRDEDGREVYQIVRLQPKDFLARRSDGDGRWIYKMGKTRRVLYQLPELLKADPAEPIFVPEGEKDCDNLYRLGLLATTNTFGAKAKWRPEFNKPLKEHSVIILPDNDKQGREHAQDVARGLYGVAANIKILELPGLPAKGDVSVWLDAGHTVDELRALAEAAPLWEPASGGVEPDIDESPKAGANGEHLSDLGNARRLVNLHGSDLIFVGDGLGWHAWDLTRYRLDSTGEVWRRAKTIPQAIYAEASRATTKDRREKLAAHAHRTENRTRIAAMIALAQSDERIVVRAEQLDSDNRLLNLQNGTLDLRSGRLRPHRPEDRITKIAGTIYDVAASCPTWESFLNRIMAGNRDLIAFLQRAIGSALSGVVREQVLIILYGSGANGKTTLIEVVLDLLRDYAKPAAPDLLLSRRADEHPTALADLSGARLVTAIETGEGRRLAEDLVKRLTGRDTMKGRFMRCNWFDFKPTWKLFLVTNHKPAIRDTTHAIWRRIRLVPFEVTIPDDEQDLDLPDKLRAELPGILNWAIAGCLAWQREGLGCPPDVVKATAAYRSEMDSIAAFLEAACVEGQDFTVRKGYLYGAYKAWAEENGEQPIAHKEFSQRLFERGFSDGRGSKGTRLWRGWALGGKEAKGDR